MFRILIQFIESKMLFPEYYSPFYVMIYNAKTWNWDSKDWFRFYIEIRILKQDLDG